MDVCLPILSAFGLAERFSAYLVGFSAFCDAAPGESIEVRFSMCSQFQFVRLVCDSSLRKHANDDTTCRILTDLSDGHHVLIKL